ncbi:hypothetical protein HPB50_015446 [Hyalomma asiaticum]|uniref:Uncharacterized protein n=1 Tax=Hyalomma asiaticum TaxID=266040 RepID=A0ACB7T815_HYAAI|nr:hypothetical protein HPB50_015446 [Hyalomma asiaticum]
MDARKGSGGNANSKGEPSDATKDKPDDDTKDKSKSKSQDNSVAVDGKAAAASAQREKAYNPFDKRFASVAPVFKAAYEGIKSLCSRSTKPSAAVSSNDGQVNQSAADKPPWPAVESVFVTCLPEHAQLDGPCQPATREQRGQPWCNSSFGTSTVVTKDRAHRNAAHRHPAPVGRTTWSPGFDSGNIEFYPSRSPNSAVGRAVPVLPTRMYIGAPGKKVANRKKPGSEDTDRQPKTQKRKKKEQGTAKPSKRIKDNDSTNPP